MASTATLYDQFHQFHQTATITGVRMAAITNPKNTLLAATAAS
jgi:hypothetical protein